MKKYLRISLLTFLTVIFLCSFACAEDISGKCGTNLTYTLNTSTGVLTISGQGPMANWDYGFYAPWRNQKALIKTVVIEEGVTTIGDWAFDFCDNLSDVKIPKSVTTIGEVAFANCYSLRSIDLPEGIKTIGGRGFYYSGLRAINIPDSVTSIGAEAFYLCSLEELNFGKGLKTIGGWAFSYCKKLKEITIPDNITIIESAAFQNCEALTSVSIPSSLTFLSGQVFLNCTALKKVTIPDGITGMGYRTFGGCTALTEIDIPASVTAIGEGAFRNCSALSTVYYGGSEADWERVSVNNKDNECLLNANVAFRENVPLYPSGTCGENLAWELKEDSLIVSGSGEMTNWESFYDIPWKNYRDSIKTVVIGSGITSVGDFAFYACNQLISLDLPETLVTIGESAFTECNRLESIRMPDGIVSLRAYAFSGCDSLSDITLPSALTDLGAGAFLECRALAEIVIPEGVLSIPTSAFMGCRNLSSVSIPKSISSIGPLAFSECSTLNVINYNGTEDDWRKISVDGFENDCLTSAKVIFIAVPSVPDTPESISGQCGESLTWKFKNGALTISGSGDMTDWENAADIPWYDFREEIYSVNIEAGVTSVGSRAFWFCSNMASINLPDGIETIGSYAFNACDSLTKINLPAGLKFIELCAFQVCANLAEVIIPDSLMAIESRAFSGCYNLKSITLPERVMYIGSVAFAGCSNLSEITIPKGILSIYDDTFTGCAALKTIYYSGDRENWNKIAIHLRNDPIYAAEIVFKDIAPDVPDQALYYGRSELEKYSNGEALIYAYNQVDLASKQFVEKASLGNENYPITKDDIWLVVNAYIDDHPEAFWIATGEDSSLSVIPMGNGGWVCLFEYTMSETMAKAITEKMEIAAEEILQEIADSMNEFDKELLIHEWLVNRVCYDETAPNRHTPYSALLEGKAVCDGYAEAFQYLLNRVGIQSYRVTGHNEESGHAWNLVRIDGEYYYVDSTWNDDEETPYHAYMNVTTEQSEETHSIYYERSSIPLPECTATSANYFVVHGGYVTELTVDGIAEVFRSSQDGVARIFAAMEDPSVVSEWFFNHDLELRLELDCFEEFGCSSRHRGREYHLTLEGYTPSNSPPTHKHIVTSGQEIKPTCTESGLTAGSFCTLCGEVLDVQEVIPALNHEEKILNAVSPTCTMPGMTEGSYCERCGETLIEQQSIPASGHDYSSEDDVDCDICGEIRKINSGDLRSVSGNVRGGKAMVVAVVGGKIVSTSTDETGNFSLENVAGSFDVLIAKAGCLTYTVKNVIVESGDVTLPEIQMVQGDVNGDDMINIMDMGAFRANFGKVGANIGNEFTDVNGDGMVNIMDMGTFRANFGKTAAKDCTVEYTV